MEGERIKRKNITKDQNIFDRLTKLPEPLLHHILSYLTMKDVIRTSVLAKRWRYIWVLVSCLNFSPMKMSMSRAKEVAFINRSLLLHKGPKVQKLNITFIYNRREAHHVDSWMHFALARNVNELYLDLLNKYPQNPSVHYYSIPHFVFSSTSLTVLALIRCHIDLPAKYKLSSLKTLSLEQVYFSGGALENLISSCPKLESISLLNCLEFGDLNLLIMNADMKTLKIHESNHCSSSSTLSIYASYLVSFELVTRMPRKYYFIHAMNSLESASFGCNKLQCGQYKADKEFSIFKMLHDVCHVKDLRLCSCYIQALSHREKQHLEYVSFDVTCLGIETQLTKGELPGIAYMLWHSPNIETLIISIHKIQAKKMEDGEYWKLQEQNFVGLLCNLKTVKIYNFMGDLDELKTKQPSTTTEKLHEQLQNDMDFLRFLLKICKVLERMVITTSKKVKFGANSESKKIKLLLQLTQDLLSFPRASREAEISFS